MTRQKFLKEITMFEEDTEHLKLLSSLPTTLLIHDQLNFVIGNVMNHLIRVFQAFKLTVFRDYNERKWLTSDNPVYLDNRDDPTWLISPKAEIYFPISKEFFLFMCNSNIASENELSKFPENVVNQADAQKHELLTSKFSENEFRYLIIPDNKERVDLRTI